MKLKYAFALHSLSHMKNIFSLLKYFQRFIFVICRNVGLNVCVCNMYIPGPWRGQKRASDSSKLELRTVVGHVGAGN